MKVSMLSIRAWAQQRLRPPWTTAGCSPGRSNAGSSRAWPLAGCQTSSDRWDTSRRPRRNSSRPGRRKCRQPRLRRACRRRRRHPLLLHRRLGEDENGKCHFTLNDMAAMWPSSWQMLYIYFLGIRIQHTLFMRHSCDIVLLLYEVLL